MSTSTSSGTMADSKKSPKPPREPYSSFDWNHLEIDKMFPPWSPSTIPDNPLVESLCIICDKDGPMMLCERCNQARYCSTACQHADWPEHKLLCRQMAKENIFRLAPDVFMGNRLVIAKSMGRLSLDTPPTTQGTAPTELKFGGDPTSKPEPDQTDLDPSLGPPYRAILWHWKRPTPRLIYYGLDEEWWKTAVGDVLEVFGDATARKKVRNLPRVQCIDPLPAVPFRKFAHGIRLFFVGGYRDRRMQENYSIVNLSATPGQAFVPYGHVIAVAVKEVQTGGESAECIQHITMRDFRGIVDYFQFHRANPCIPTNSIDRYPFSAYGVQGYPAVKANCDGDQKRFRHLNKHMNGTPFPHYESVWVTSQSLNTERYDCYLANLAELPWLMQECTTNDNLPRRVVDGYHTTPLAETMQWTIAMTYDVHEKQAKRMRGSILFVHDLGAPIHPYHVQALSEAFTMDAIAELINCSKRGDLSDTLFIAKNRKPFEAFWKSWMEKNHKDEIDEIVSPWECEKDPKMRAEVDKLFPNREPPVLEDNVPEETPLDADESAARDWFSNKGIVSPGWLRGRTRRQ